MFGNFCFFFCCCLLLERSRAKFEKRERGMRKVVTPLIPSGNRIFDRPADKKIILLQSTYGHDYPALDKRNCVEGTHTAVLARRLPAERIFIRFHFSLSLFLSRGALECCKRDRRGKIERAGCAGCFRHCQTRRKLETVIAPVSEYKDTVSRIGGVITKAKLNDHRKCKAPAGCVHFYKLE